MIGTTSTAWLFSLAEDPNSNWGAVDDFYASVDACNIEDDRIIIDSQVWGTLQSISVRPAAGDGFAFYHSTRAVFPPNDKFKRKPRISLIGELLEIQLDGRNMGRIRVAVDPDVLAALKRHPIVRDDSTRSLFEDCGIVRGAVATLYRADSATWKRLVGRIHRDAN